MNTEHLIEKKIIQDENLIANVKDKSLDGIKNINENHSFISIVSHNIKNPFATLLGFSELLSDDYNELTDHERKFYLNEIKKSANFSYKYFERFFEWLYYKTGKIELDFNEVNLFQNLRNVVNNLPEKLRSKCEINLSFDTNVNVYIDDESIKKAFFYLIENAIKYSENKKEIRIETELSPSSIDIKIIDVGIGIAEADIKKLFDHTQDPSLISSFGEKGTGMGLILAKLLTEINGGTISVKSSLGNGSIFCIKLPFNKHYN